MKVIAISALINLLLISSMCKIIFSDIAQDTTFRETEQQNEQKRLIVVKQKISGRHTRYITKKQLDFAISLIENNNGKVIFNHETNSHGIEGHFEHVNAQTEEEKQEIDKFIEKEREYYLDKYPKFIDSKFFQQKKYLRNQLQGNKLDINIHMKSPKQLIAQQKQLPFCILIPSFNNAKKKFYIRNINSIFQQEYTNYRIVYMDDASEDNTTENVLNYIKEKFPSYQYLGESRIMENQTSEINIITIRDFEFNKIQWKFVLNQKRRKAMFNIYNGALSFCQDNEIVILIDGDDAFVGTQTLKMMSRAYTETQAMFVYTSYVLRKDIPKDRFINVNEDEDVLEALFSDNGITLRPYNEDKKTFGPLHKNLKSITSYEIGPAGQELQLQLVQQQKLRTISFLLGSHILSFYTSLLRKAPTDNFMDNNGKFLDYAYDTALTLSLGELAYKRTFFFKEIFYEYTSDTGINDSPQNWSRASWLVAKKKPNQPLSDSEAKQMVRNVLYQ